MGELPNDIRLFAELGVAVYAACVVIFILLERRRPAATLAWLLALVLLPVVGLGIYLLIGRRRVRKSKKRRARRAINPTDATRDMANVELVPSELPETARSLVRLALNTSDTPVRRADQVHVLGEAAEAFAAMGDAIDAAQHRIHLEFYIWRDDDAGRDMVRRLAARAADGVKVRLLYDDLGSIGTRRSHFAPLVEAGGEVAAYGKLSLRIRLRRRSRLDFRNHRKILCTDGKVGFTGGLNIANEYRGTRADGTEWNDLMVRIDGDATLGLEAIFLEDWLSATGELVEPTANLPGVTPIVMRDEPNTPISSQGPAVQIIPSGPDLLVASAVAAQFVASISIAQTRCWIATPYFIPDVSLTLILRTAALRGVDVRIMVPLPRHNDSKLVSLAASSYYDVLLEAGCRIFEYEPGMLHAKYLLVDDHVSAVGSANFDLRSLHINYEVTAMMYDEQVNGELSRVFLGTQNRCREVEAATRAELPFLERLGEGFARVLSPLM